MCVVRRVLNESSLLAKLFACLYDYYSKLYNNNHKRVIIVGISFGWFVECNTIHVDPFRWRRKQQIYCLIFDLIIKMSTWIRAWFSAVKVLDPNKECIEKVRQEGSYKMPLWVNLKTNTINLWVFQVDSLNSLNNRYPKKCFPYTIV